MQFKDIEGQHIISNMLTEIVDSGRVPHAQLFLGASADGALALAIAYAQYLNCSHRQHYDTALDGNALRADSCGTCPSCAKFAQLTHADLHFVFPNASVGSVKKDPCSDDFQQEFREFLQAYHQHGALNDWYAHLGMDNKQGMIRERDADNSVGALSLRAYEGNYKTLIVWMAEKMNATAANKLLKTLEEPTDHTLMILVAENTDGMLPTILSRVQTVAVPQRHLSNNLSSPYATQFVDWMRQLFKLNMKTLSEQVDALSALGRERQKEFLRYALQTVEACFLNSAASRPVALNSGDAKFDNAFPSMITCRNVELMEHALSDALYAIERNAHPKITFMKLSFVLSKALKGR